LNHSSYNNWC